MDYRITYQFDNGEYDYLVDYWDALKTVAYLTASEFFGRSMGGDKYFCEEVQELIEETTSEELLFERYKEDLKDYYEYDAKCEYEEARKNIL